MKDVIAQLIATIFFLGYFPIASGTVGAFVGIFIYLAIKNLSPLFYLIFTLIFFAVSLWSANQAEIYLKEKDSPKIIIDEAVSFLVTMFLIPYSLKTVALGFVLNRFFDITKIYPANIVEKKVKGGAGIMLDDIIAGIYSNILLRILILLFPKLLT